MVWKPFVAGWLTSSFATRPGPCINDQRAVDLSEIPPSSPVLAGTGLGLKLAVAGPALSWASTCQVQLLAVETRPNRRNVGRTFSKLWLPAVILIVIAIVSYGRKPATRRRTPATGPTSSVRTWCRHARR